LANGTVKWFSDKKGFGFLQDEKGVPDMEKITPVLFAPEIMAYYGIGEFLGKAWSIGKRIS